MKIYKNIFEKIISVENLFKAWETFKHGKTKRKDVQEFEWELEQNIFKLYRDLKLQKYRHGEYKPFYINDPKQRLIHKATVRDRVVHHAIYKVLNPIFEPNFIANSFSCRVGKGTHKGVKVLSKILRKVSKNNTHPCFALKGDIKKFFNSVDHKILLTILNKRIIDKKTLWLLTEIIESHSATIKESNIHTCGIPIGNLTSQLFANIYLNELDQFVKHKLKLRHYLRYTDDFVIVSENRRCLERLIDPISIFLDEQLKLSIHPKKINIRKYKQGIDFLGYVMLPHHTMVRTNTKKRMLKKSEMRTVEYKRGLISKETLKQTIASYVGVLSHANSYKLIQEINKILPNFDKLA